MNYCKKCILPDTRPHLVIGEDGVCNACHSKRDNAQDVDWNQRERDFQQFVQNIKNKKADWDCVIPVSGGKDSTWQVIKALEYGLKPLCVTWRTPARNELGQENLDNLIQLGVDHIDFSINPKTEKAFTLKALKEKGSVAIPMHMALFAIPTNIALKFKIPLVLWGENSGIEYGGSDRETLGVTMNKKWLFKYGVTHGTEAKDWIDEELTPEAMKIYQWPSDEELKIGCVTAAFLGWFFPWDPQQTFDAAKANGFKALSGKPKTGYYQFADVDDAFLITLHHWVKWYKFGFTRLWDNLSLEIRNGRMTREEAIRIVCDRGNEYPKEEILAFCSWAGITENKFLEIVEKFRNKEIWDKEISRWKIKDFLIHDWKW